MKVTRATSRRPAPLRIGLAALACGLLPLGGCSLGYHFSKEASHWTDQSECPELPATARTLVLVWLRRDLMPVDAARVSSALRITLNPFGKKLWHLPHPEVLVETRGSAVQATGTVEVSSFDDEHVTVAVHLRLSGLPDNAHLPVRVHKCLTLGRRPAWY